MINQAREQRIAMMNEMGDDLRALLPKHRISINNEALNKSQAIDVSVQSLVEDSIVKPAYAEEIKMQFEKF
ncbi:PTS sugar transporter subunit IIA, partial [Klebsiella pneumoniae]|nr:PTS sugar transporter subunit IIA [Klebsiella pneumoniae]